MSAPQTLTGGKRRAPTGARPEPPKPKAPRLESTTSHAPTAQVAKAVATALPLASTIPRVSNWAALKSKMRKSADVEADAAPELTKSVHKAYTLDHTGRPGLLPKSYVLPSAAPPTVPHSAVADATTTARRGHVAVPPAVIEAPSAGATARPPASLAATSVKSHSLLMSAAASFTAAGAGGKAGAVAATVIRGAAVATSAGASTTASVTAAAVATSTASGTTAVGAVAVASVDAAAKKRSILGPFDTAELTPAEQRYVAVDCEMVGVGAEGARSALAQVVIVDYAGRVVYEKYVKCAERVTDYRTAVSGIRPEHLSNPAFGAVDFATAQREVAELVRGKVIVGHALHNDMKALMMGHSWREVRDTAKYRLFTFRNKAGQLRPRRLKHLALQHLGCVIQEGEHEPAEDARAALALYRRYRREWETGPTSGGAAAGGPAAGGAGGAGARGRSKSGGPGRQARAAAAADVGDAGSAAAPARERSASAPRKLKGGGGWQEIKRARGAKAERKAANVAAGIFPGRPGHPAAAGAAGGADAVAEAAQGAGSGSKSAKGGKQHRGRSFDSRKPRRDEGGIPDFD